MADHVLGMQAMSALWTPGPKTPRRARLHVGHEVVEVETMKPNGPVNLIALDQDGQPAEPVRFRSLSVASITVRRVKVPEWPERERCELIRGAYRDAVRLVASDGTVEVLR